LHQRAFVRLAGENRGLAILPLSERMLRSIEPQIGLA
jgi:hypothetical protein